MTHSATTRTDMAWNQPESLGFSILQRHLCASPAARSSLVRETAGGLRTAFERHGEFAGHILARKVVPPAADGLGGHGGQDSLDMEFVHLASRSGRARSSGVSARTGLTRSTAEKSGFARISGSPPALEAVAQAQQVQRDHAVRRAIHGVSSLISPRISRGRPEDSASLPGSPRSASIAAGGVMAGNDRSGERGHELAAPETGLFPVRPESIGIPAALIRIPVMPATAESGNAALQGSSGSMPPASSEMPASALSVSHWRYADIGSGSRLPLAPDRGNRGISAISPVSGIVARQAGGMADSNSNRLAGTPIGMHAERHVPPEAAKLQRSLPYRGKFLVQTARTRGEARISADVAIAGPERNAQVVTPGTQTGSANEEYAPSTARAPVLARQSIPDISMPNEAQKIHNGEGNADSITRTEVVSKDTNAPGNRAVHGHAGSASDPIVSPPVFPSVFPASSSTLVLRQVEPQHLSRKGFMDAHHAGRLPLRSQADALAIRPTRVEAISGIARSRIWEQPASPAAREQGNRHGDSTHSHFPLRHAMPDTVLRAVDRADRVSGMVPAIAPAISGSGGKERSFLARTPGLASHALSASRISGGESILAGLVHLPGERPGTMGELRGSDAALRRTAIASPVSASGSIAVPVHPPAAGIGESWPAATPSWHGNQEAVQRKPNSAPAGSPALSPVLSPASRIFAMQAHPWSRGRDRLEAGPDEGTLANPSRAASSRADTATAGRPLVLIPRIPQMPQMQRMEAGMGDGEAAWGRIMRADDARGGSAHSFPLTRQETPEDRYGVVPAPSQGQAGVHGVPGSEVAAAETSTGKPDTDEMAAQTWRLISERLVIEQERRGLAPWHR